MGSWDVENHFSQKYAVSVWIVFLRLQCISHQGISGSVSALLANFPFFSKPSTQQLLMCGNVRSLTQWQIIWSNNTVSDGTDSWHSQASLHHLYGAVYTWHEDASLVMWSQVDFCKYRRECIQAHRGCSQTGSLEPPWSGSRVTA